MLKQSRDKERGDTSLERMKEVSRVFYGIFEIISIPNSPPLVGSNLMFIVHRKKTSSVLKNVQFFPNPYSYLEYSKNRLT